MSLTLPTPGELQDNRLGNALQYHAYSRIFLFDENSSFSYDHLQDNKGKTADILFHEGRK